MRIILNRSLYFRAASACGDCSSKRTALTAPIFNSSALAVVIIPDKRNRITNSGITLIFFNALVLNNLK